MHPGLPTHLLPPPPCPVPALPWSRSLSRSSCCFVFLSQAPVAMPHWDGRLQEFVAGPAAPAPLAVLPMSSSRLGTTPELRPQKCTGLLFHGVSSSQGCVSDPLKKTCWDVTSCCSLSGDGSQANGHCGFSFPPGPAGMGTCHCSLLLQARASYAVLCHTRTQKRPLWKC